MSKPLGMTRAALHRARRSRDPRFDGRFFVAVRTTGIYCRPICPSPHSKDSNVDYVDSAAAAAELGCRPCLRCRPEAAPGSPAWQGTSAVVRRALLLIQQGAMDGCSVEDFATRLGLGARQLNRLLVKHVGASPVALAQTRRLQFAKRLIDDTCLPMTSVALAAGFGSLRRFNDAFRTAYQRTPRELRRQRMAFNAQAENGVRLRLAYHPPYDWHHAWQFLAARAVPGLEHVDAHGYTRNVWVPSGSVRVTVRPVANEYALEVRLEGAQPEHLYPLSQVARRVFDLGCDPLRVTEALGADPMLRALRQVQPGLRIIGAWEPFECAVRAILGQQISLAAGRTLLTRVVHRFGAPLQAGRGSAPSSPTHHFPTPAVLAAASSLDPGITGTRQNTVRELARAVCSGAVDFAAAPEAVVAALLALPGVGHWTAQYVALRALGVPDAFPAGDLVLRRQAGRPGGELTERELGARAETWQPWRGYAAMHLWAAHASQPAVRGLSRPRAA